MSLDIIPSYHSLGDLDGIWMIKTLQTILSLQKIVYKIFLLNNLYIFKNKYYTY